MAGGFSGVYASGPSAASHGTQLAESMRVDVEYRFGTMHAHFTKSPDGRRRRWLLDATPQLGSVHRPVEHVVTADEAGR